MKNIVALDRLRLGQNVILVIIIKGKKLIILLIIIIAGVISILSHHTDRFTEDRLINYMFVI